MVMTKKIINKVQKSLFGVSFILTSLGTLAQARIVEIDQNEVREETPQQNLTEQAANLLADNFLNFYTDKQREISVLTTLQNIAPLRPWVKNLYISHINSHGIEGAFQLNRFMILNRYIDLSCEMIRNNFDYLSSPSCREKNTFEQLIQQLKHASHLVDVDCLGEYFLNYYHRKERLFPVLIDLKNKINLTRWIKNYYKIVISSHGFETAAQLNPVLILTFYIKNSIRVIKNSDTYLCEDHHKENSLDQLVIKLGQIIALK